MLGESATAEGRSTLDARLAQASVTATALAMFFALAGLAAFLPGLGLLGAVWPGLIPMAPSTAFGFLALGGCLLLLRRRRGVGANWVVRVVSTLVGLFGLLEMLEHFVGVDLTFEDMLVPEAGTLSGVPVARMSPLTGGLFLAAAAAVAAHAYAAPGRRRLAPALAAATLVLSAPVLLGYLLNAPLLYGTGTIPMALTTAVAFACLGLSAFCLSGSDAPAVAALFGPSTHARLLRWFLPVTMAAAVVGSLGLRVIQIAFDVSQAFDVAALLLVVMVATALVVTRVARLVGRTIDALSHARLELEAQQAALELQLERARKLEALGKLAGGVAHDFNNVLTVIVCSGEGARDCLPPDHEAVEFMNDVLRAAQRARLLTGQLLAIGRRETARPQVLALDVALAEAEKFLRDIVAGKAELRFLYEGRLWPVALAPAQLDQILMNLVMNAADAMPEGGTITVRARNRSVAQREETDPAEASDIAPGHYVALTVADEGAGMDAETQRQIFEPFFSTKGARGTGLGLATVHAIATQAGGEVLVRSEPGRGSELEVLLPRATSEPPAEAEPVSGKRANQRRPGWILVVDDEGPVRRATCRSLENGGYRVIDVATGEEALEVLEEDPGGEIHLMLVDVTMPGITGTDTVEQARRIRPSLCILYMSGYAGDIVSAGGAPAQNVGFIQKPFDRHALLAKVAGVIAASKRRARGRSFSRA